MGILMAKCTQCGAKNEVDENKEAAICKLCGEAFIVKKAVDSYNHSYNVYTDIHVNNLNDFIIRAGELVDYIGASSEVFIPNGVKIIGKKAFGGCLGLEKVVIPDSVTEIYGFNGCRFNDIIIPTSVLILGGFQGCSFSNIIIPYGVKIIAHDAFRGCRNLTEIEIPESVEKIETWAFGNCDNLKTITIKSNRTELEVWRDSESTRRAFQCSLNIKCVNAPEEWKIKYKDFFPFLRLSKEYPSKNTTGCYIATSVYGSYDCPQVWTLRRFRDYTLGKTWYGRAFIRCYYIISPILVRWFGHKKWFKQYWKSRLDKMVADLNNKGVDNTNYHDI